jgi:hypothetical protein
VLETIDRELGDLDQVACWLKVNEWFDAVSQETPHEIDP